MRALGGCAPAWLVLRTAVKTLGGCYVSLAHGVYPFQSVGPRSIPQGGHTYIHICVYVERGREGERQRDRERGRAREREGDMYYTILYALYYTIHYILYTIYYILYTIYYILYTIHYILYTIYYILYTIYYILYTIIRMAPTQLGPRTVTSPESAEVQAEAGASC